MDHGNVTSMHKRVKNPCIHFVYVKLSWPIRSLEGVAASLNIQIRIDPAERLVGALLRGLMGLKDGPASLNMWMTALNLMCR